MRHESCFECGKIGHRPDMFYNTYPDGWLSHWFCKKCYNNVLDEFAIRRCIEKKLLKNNK